MIKYSISHQRFKKKLKRRKLKLLRHKRSFEKYLKLKKTFKGQITYEQLIERWLPKNLKFLIYSEKSVFYIKNINFNVPKNGGIFKVPKEFSLLNNPNEVYSFLSQLTASLILQSYPNIKIDYEHCINVDLEAQVLLDIILKDIITFFKKCDSFKLINSRVKTIEGINVKNTEIKKMLFSVGSPAIHSQKTVNYPDIIPYRLCIHDREKNGDIVKIMEQKDIDTTELADYVLDCLKRFNKTLTSDQIDDLCIVIGETLINAEEHSTTQYRFSIGYFKEISNNDGHFGQFRLVILNFGKTIYEKFKDPKCPNIGAVSKMKELSENYTKKRFLSSSFEEETLWTLYALQEGITSIPPNINLKRGNGSIRFIESFFKLKSSSKQEKSISQLNILSGNTKITFDGTYNIQEKQNGEEKFRVMTFNESGTFEDKPDQKFVRVVKGYFPGTIISANILFNEND